MSQVVVQDVRLPCTSSESIVHPSLLRPIRRRAVQGWVCGRVEGATLWSGCRGKGFEDILK